VDVVVQEDETVNILVSLKFMLWSRSFGLRRGRPSPECLLDR